MNTPQTLDEVAVSERFSDPAILEYFAQQKSIDRTAAETLEESEASYRHFFEANPHPMWIYDCDTFRFLLVNNAAIERYGYSRDEFLAMTIMDIRPVEDIPLVLESLISQTPATGKRGVWRHRKKDGQIFDVEITLLDFRFRGKTARLALANDVTERRTTEQTLHHIMEGAHCLLWQAEVEEDAEAKLQWKVHFASEQAAQRFIPLHLTSGQDYNAAWYISRPTEDRERTDAYGAREIRAGRSYQQEFRSRSKDGTLHWLSENVHVEVLGEGKWRCTGVCTDITERKLAEEATRTMTRGAQCLLWYAFVEKRLDGFLWVMKMPDEEAAKQFFPVKQSPGQSYVVAWTRSRLPEDDTAMQSRATAALLGGQHEYTQQFRCLRADGEWRWLNEMVSIEVLGPGRWRCVGVCVDITEQKRAEEERDRILHPFA